MCVHIKPLEVPGQTKGDDYLCAVLTSNEKGSDEESFSITHFTRYAAVLLRNDLLSLKHPEV